MQPSSGNFEVPASMPPPSQNQVHIGLDTATFWDGGGIERGILEAYDLGKPNPSANTCRAPLLDELILLQFTSSRVTVMKLQALRSSNPDKLFWAWAWMVIKNSPKRSPQPIGGMHMHRQWPQRSYTAAVIASAWHILPTSEVTAVTLGSSLGLWVP